MNVNENAAKIIHTLKSASYEAVLVGGCVRDMLLDKEPHDWDIATDASPAQIEALFKKSIPVGKYFGVITVLENGDSFEVATFRTDGSYVDGRRPTSVKFSSMKEDALRRDLTINGLFYDIDKHDIIDYVGGQFDLYNGIIRFIGNPDERIQEDHLRILRAVRFALRYGFKIDSDSLKAIEKYSHLLKSVSNERIRDELDKILSVRNYSEALNMLSETGILKHILPEVEALHDCEQSPRWHPEGNVWNHTLMVMDNLLPDATSETAWGALLHDVGKPSVTVLNKDGEWASPLHESESERVSIQILTRLKFSNEFIKAVCFIVGNHMKIKQADSMRLSKIKKLMANPYSANLIAVSYADSMSSNGKEELEWYSYIQNNLEKWKAEELLPPPVLSGIDLIELGMKPSPKFGEILSAVYDEQLDGSIMSKKDALEFVNKLLTTSVT